MADRLLAYKLGINHQSPLIHLHAVVIGAEGAGNQSPIPFDTLGKLKDGPNSSWESITNPL